MKHHDEGHVGHSTRGGECEAGLPHPSPLPLGEGATHAAAADKRKPSVSDSSAAFPKPNGLESSSPGLRGTSYPG